MVLSKDARTSGSSPSWLSRDMMPKIVLPHWLRATKLWKHSKTTSFLLKCSPLPAFFSQYQAIVFRVGDAPVRHVVEPRSRSTL